MDPNPKQKNFVIKQCKFLMGYNAWFLILPPIIIPPCENGPLYYYYVVTLVRPLN
jgi:hypothetical protein